MAAGLSARSHALPSQSFTPEAPPQYGQKVASARIGELQEAHATSVSRIRRVWRRSPRTSIKPESALPSGTTRMGGVSSGSTSLSIPRSRISGVDTIGGRGGGGGGGSGGSGGGGGEGSRASASGATGPDAGREEGLVLGGVG